MGEHEEELAPLARIFKEGTHRSHTYWIEDGRWCMCQQYIPGHDRQTPTASYTQSIEHGDGTTVAIIVNAVGGYTILTKAPTTAPGDGREFLSQVSKDGTGSQQKESGPEES